MKTKRFRPGLWILLVGLGTILVFAWVRQEKANDKIPGTTRGEGAGIPWESHEAEDGHTNAVVHGPSRKYQTPEAESSGRRFVRLEAVGDHVEFTVTKAADSIVVRYVIPDAPDGGGIASTLSLYSKGKFERKLPVSSRYSWIYGDFPWSNDPTKGMAHHFYDEAHARIAAVSPGDVIRLQKDATDTAGYYLIDLIELEKIPAPLPQPEGSLPITRFGATANDATDDSAALVKCIESAKADGKSVWIPEGEFLLNGPRISVGDVRVNGAGMWHSSLTGSSPMFAGTGRVEFSDLAIFGGIDHRNDRSPDNAFDGNFGRGSVFRNLWIEHVKCGFWTTRGTGDMRVEGCRIRNTMADGLNFCEGTSRSIVKNCHLRNTGDDALATWSPDTQGKSLTPCVGNAFLRNTIQLPWLANGIALYGGSDHLVADNKIDGTVFSGGGILLSSGFGAFPFGGKIRLERNRITDTGGDCYIGETIGGLWIHAKDSEIMAQIEVSGLYVADSANSAITVHGSKKVAALTLKDIEINGAGEHGIHIKSTADGAMRVRGFQTSGIRLKQVVSGSSEKFPIVIE